MKTKKRIWLTGIAVLMFVFQGFCQTTVVNGLVVVVNFEDYKLKASMAELEDMFNKPTGFNLWNNEMSVREYFRVQTNNKIDLVNTIVSVDLDQNSTYYVGHGASGNLANDVIAAVNQKYPTGFFGLTEHPTQGRLYNFSMISQSQNGTGVAWGTEAYIQNNGLPMRIANVSHVSWVNDFAYDVNVICHEYGHSVWNWTDYYRTAFCNLGMFDLMSSAGSAKGAMPINPALRMQRGWVDTITNVPGNLTATYSLQANSYSRVYRYVNPANPKEYLIFHALKHDKYYQSSLYGTPTPEGLAIWYVDEETGFDLSGQDDQFVVKLVQADNLDQMHDEDAPGSVRGDMYDLYGNSNKSFPNGHPWRWKDGGEFGITLSNITKSGNNVNFTVLGRTRTVIALPDINGTLTPKGTINVPSSTSQSFTFTPDPGYELVDILVDDQPVPISNPYILTGIGTTPKTIQPIYTQKSTIPALPEPWQKAQIGTTGLAVYEAGTFGLEAEGGSIGSVSDKFSYAYQTISGNATIIARVASSNKPNWNFRAGIMIRESLQANAVQTMLVKAAYDGNRIEQRTATGNYLQGNPNGIGDLHAYNLYNWLKITRTGNEFISYCSRDGINWMPVAQQTINMPAQVLIGLCVAGGVQYFPAKATFDNVSISTTGAPTCVFSGTKITGTSIGTEGAWANSGATRDKAFDGNIFSDFDAPIGNAWTGLSLSSEYRITGIKYFPRKKSMNRMVGGKFQGSNTADFSSGVVDLETISTEPAYDWTCIEITNPSSFAYIRYVGPNGGHGNIAEIEFYGSAVVLNTSPEITITSPIANASFFAPATINIAANATDVDGNIEKVEFYHGNTLLGTDYTAPYSYTWSNVGAGSYNIIAKATDNNGAIVYDTVGVSVHVSTADITGPACAANNTALVYELAPAKRANVTGYGWYFTGSTQTFAPSSSIPYQVTMVTGNNFGSGQLCVGVSYSVSPWYSSYCIEIPKCSNTREVILGGAFETNTKTTASLVFPNPFTSETKVILADGIHGSTIQVYNANGVLVEEDIAFGVFNFGKNVKSGIYFLKISTDNKTETLKLVKE
jgi:M6 family metalloprotease-like protein